MYWAVEIEGKSGTFPKDRWITSYDTAASLAPNLKAAEKAEVRAVCLRSVSAIGRGGRDEVLDDIRPLAC